MLESCQEYFQSSVIYFMLYYVEGCEWKPEEDYYKVYVAKIQEGIVFIHDILTELSNNPDDLSEFCDGGASQKVRNIIYFTHGVFHIAIFTLTKSLKIFRCSNFNPIYTEVVHEVLCYNGVS